MEHGVRQVVVEAAHDGRKLFSFLRALLGPLPQSLLLRLTRTGQIRVDGKRVQPFTRLAAGQTVRIPPMATRQPVPAPAAAADLPMVRITAELVVVDKPAGLPVHPGSGWSDAVTVRLAARFPEFAPIPVHRLDRATSGLLLCARTHAALRRLHATWPHVRKGYLAWVAGAWPHGEVLLDAPLAKAGRPGREKVQVGWGKAACTLVTPLVVEEGRSLLGVILGTGRTHQIRAHLAHAGHPVVGDGKYGTPGPRLFLHAAVLHGPDLHLTALPQWPAPCTLTPAHLALIESWINRVPTASV